MTSTRRAIKEGWQEVKIQHPVERGNADLSPVRTRHRSLNKWVVNHRVGRTASTLVCLAGHYPMSIFAFENGADAAYFTLKWK